MQFRGTPHWQFAKSPHHQRGIIIARDISEGHKQKVGLAWWPGFLPFTLDWTTLNTTKFQHAANNPHTTTKYRTWRYYATISNTYTDNFDNPVAVESSIELALTFDAIYGDLSAATATRIFTINGDPEVTFPDYDYTWTRADGLFVDSDIYAIVNPDSAAWGYLSGSDVKIDNHARVTIVTAAAHGNIPSSGIVTLDATELVWDDEADYDPGEAIGTDGHYILTTSITLSDAYTYLACANDAKALSDGVSLSLRNTQLSMFYGGVGSATLTKWRDPATYTYTTEFCFWGDANDLVTAGDATSATNYLAAVKNRHVSATILFNLGLKKPEGMMVSYGYVNVLGSQFILFELEAPDDWWDEGETAIAIRSGESLVNLATGLFDGNTVVPPTYPFPLAWYYDFEMVLPHESDLTMTTNYVGVYDKPAGVRAFPITELQTQLAAISRTYGTGWLAEGVGTRPASPY
jgi:hypothetical protein